MIRDNSIALDHAEKIGEMNGEALQLQVSRERPRAGEEKNCAWSAEYKRDYGDRINHQAQFVCATNTQLPHTFNYDERSMLPFLAWCISADNAPSSRAG